MKRKADTTTPIPPMAADPYEPDFDDSNISKDTSKFSKLGSASKNKLNNSAKMTPNKVSPASVVTPTVTNSSVSTPVSAAKITPARRESNRQIKKPKRDLPEEKVEGENVSGYFRVYFYHAMHLMQFG